VNALELVGKRYDDIPTRRLNKASIIVGAPYLITRDYTPARVVIARQKAHDKGILSHDGYNWYASLINPEVQKGDNVYALTRTDGRTVLHRERMRRVIDVTNDGIITQYGDANPVPVGHWVLADEGAADPKKDRYNPKRREIVLERLSNEGMRRIGDTGYAVSAREFFDHFDLPRPEVEPTALVDVERDVSWNEMGYDMRALFEHDNVTSLRNATIKGRAKITLEKSTCRCAEVTEEEVLKAWKGKARWKNPKLHKVQCMWCAAREKDGSLPEEAF
jgi:hypothetical protein